MGIVSEHPTIAPARKLYSCLTCAINSIAAVPSRASSKVPRPIRMLNLSLASRFNPVPASVRPGLHIMEPSAMVGVVSSDYGSVVKDPSLLVHNER